ncbi:MAG: CUB domain-containing protein [Bacteroidota bacterium]
MKKLITNFYFVVVLFSAILFHSLDLFSQEGNGGTLSFFVSDAENGYGTPAEILFSNEKKSFRLKTNEAGHLLFEGEEGNYTIQISANGHHPLSTYFIVKNGQSQNINIIMDRLNKTYLEYKNYESAVVEGYVVDIETGKPLADVNVELSAEKLSVRTNKEGFFSISPGHFAVITKRKDKGVRSDFSFSIKDYTSKTIENLLLLPDKIKLKIVLKKGSGNDSEKYVQHILDGTAQDVEMYEKSIPQSNSQKTKTDINSFATGCVIPTTIRVGTSCSCTSCTSVDVMSLQYYSESGIDDEWISSWQFESLAAGSVPYRSYGGWYVNNPVNVNFDIASSTCNQVWGSAVYTNAQSAAQATVGQIVTANGIDPARSEYSAENNQGGTSFNCTDCNAGGSGAYSCFSDNQCCGQSPAGHGRGMCQWGTQYWAQNGQNSQWIIDHYFIATIGYSICGSSIPPSNLSVTNSSCPQIGVTLNWNDSGSGWVMDISADSNFTAYFNKSIANLNSIVCPGGFCEYPNCSDYLQFKPGTTYYWRIWDGSTYTYGSSFTTPICSTLDVNCSGSIDDSGGSGGNYGGNEDYTFTISPNNASSVSLNFSSFDLEANSDSLYLYDGPSNASALIGGYTALNSPGTVSSTGGAITLHFISDPFVNNDGFSATWTCTSAPTGSEDLGNNLSAVEIYPNPANEDAYLHYVLSAPGFFTVKLFDVLGREISLLSNGYQTAGDHTIHIDVNELALSEGIYTIRFINAVDRSTNIKLIITTSER